MEIVNCGRRGQLVGHRNCSVPARFGSMLVLDLAEIALLYGRWRLKRG